MSTSYTKFILFLLGILIISPGSFAQTIPDPGDSDAYLFCNPKVHGVPVCVVVEGLSELEKKDKDHYIQQVMDKENKPGKLDCRPAGYTFTESMSHCPIGQYWVCWKNSPNVPNPNNPKDLGPNAPMGICHGFIKINSNDAKHGLKGALEKEGFFKKDFADPTDYTNGISRDDNHRVATADACMAYSATDDMNCGIGFHQVEVGKRPGAPAVPMIEKPDPIVPSEIYRNSPSTEDCSGTLTCDEALDCEAHPEKVFAETCGAKSCGNFTVQSCLNDYETFCHAGAPVCGDDHKTNVPVPANIVANAAATANAIEALKAATNGMTDSSGTEIHITKCGLFGVMNAGLSGVDIPTASTQTRYTNCVKENNSSDPTTKRLVALRRDDLDYLEKLLKAFANPGSAVPPADISGIKLGFLTHLAKLESVDATTFYKALNVSNPSTDAINAYNALVKSLNPIVGNTAAPSDMDGTILGFAQKTHGGVGYLGITPASQQSSGSLTYIDILDKLKNNNSSPLCMQIPDPAYMKKEFQDKYLKAIVRDHAIAKNITDKLKSCSQKPSTLPPAGTKPYKRPATGK